MTKFRRNYVGVMTILVTGLMSSNPTIAAGGQSVALHGQGPLRGSGFEYLSCFYAEGSRGEKAYS